MIIEIAWLVQMLQHLLQKKSVLLHNNKKNKDFLTICIIFCVPLGKGQGKKVIIPWVPENQ